MLVNRFNKDISDYWNFDNRLWSIDVVIDAVKDAHNLIAIIIKEERALWDKVDGSIYQ